MNMKKVIKNLVLKSLMKTGVLLNIFAWVTMSFYTYLKRSLNSLKGFLVARFKILLVFAVHQCRPMVQDIFHCFLLLKIRTTLFYQLWILIVIKMI